VMIALKSEKGITLVELIIAIGLIAIVITLGFMFYFTGVRAFDRNIDRAEIQQNVRHSMSYISKRLLNANNAVVVVTPIVDAPDELRIGIELFRLTGTTLRVNHNFPSSTTFNPLAEGITEFAPVKEGKMITVTISAGTAQQDNFFTLTTQVLLRR